MKRYKLIEILETMEWPRDVYDISEAARIRTLKSEQPAVIKLTYGTDAYFTAELTPLGLAYLEHIRQQTVVVG